jgi:hypothetical protein
MPEIRLPKPEVEKEFELESALISPPKIKLKLKPLSNEASFKRVLQMKKLFPRLKESDVEKGSVPDQFVERLPEALKTNIPFVLNHVVGWDLTLPGGKSLPCTKQNKATYLVPLLWETAKGNTKNRSRFFMGEILDFISDMRNFTKN